MVAALIQSVVSSHASVAIVPAPGDLSVYSLGYHSSSIHAPGPTLFLLLDPSLYVGPNHTQRIQSLQQALASLMDTPGFMADNLQVGIGKVADIEQSEIPAELLLVPVAALGPVADSQRAESQRYKIKNFIKGQCPQFPDCEAKERANDGSILSTMAAYAQAAAYMMGTDTQNTAINLTNISGSSSAALPLSIDEIEIVDIQNTKSQLPLEQPIFKVNQLNGVDDTRDIDQIVSISKERILYEKPIYNQCSARYFEGEKRNDSTYAVENAVVIISSESALTSLNSSTSAAAISTIDPLAMMTQSLLAKHSSSASNDLISQPPVLQQCHSQLAMSSSTKALSSTLNQTHNQGLEDRQPNNSLFWRCVQDYARHLNQFRGSAYNYFNPLDVSLKTAVISFSSESNILNRVGQNKGLPSYDCLSNTATQATRQKCLLGQYGNNNGEGGFFQSIDAKVATASQKDSSQSVALAQVLTIMANNLSRQSPIVARKAPIQLTNFMHSGELFKERYQTFLQPQFGTLQAQWPGGMSKYSPPQSGQSAVSNNSFIAKSIEEDNQVLDNPRNVYLSQSEPGELIAQTTQSVSKLQLPKLTQEQQAQFQQSLLHYMLDRSQPSAGVHNSTPIALISKAQRLTSNETGITNQPNADKYSYKKHILYGGMDNALHIIDAETGEEIAAYFAKEVLTHNGQYKAITQGSLAQSTEAIPNFGIDGPWTQYARYQTDTKGQSIAKPLYVFGGARLGAKAYYGLDLTGLDKVVSASNLNGFAPKQLFTITPDRQDFGQFYFKKLGYSWGKPVITHINWFGVPTLVAILSGGYDAQEYDKPDGLRERHYLQQEQQLILGNAIYIIDAKTGVPLIVATAKNGTDSSSSGVDNKGFYGLSKEAGKVLQVTNASMAYSITGSVKVMDREEDGLTDHLYFADLQGQVFRLDLDNVASSSALASKARVVRLADFRHQTNLPGPRFYETPVVTLQSHNAVNSHSSKFATVSVASGDRSHPLRITDPSKQTVAMSIEYVDSFGHKQTLQANHKQFLATDNKKAQLGDSDWQWIASDKTLSRDNNSSDIRFDNGHIQLATGLFTPGTLLTATTTFASTDKVSATLTIPSSLASNTESQLLPSITDPLAPIITVTKDWVSIKPMTTAQLSGLSLTANHVYTLYDKDVANPDLFNTAISDLQTHDLSVTEDGFPDLTKIDVSNPQLSGYQKQGWRAPLIQFGKQGSIASGASAGQNNQNSGFDTESSGNSYNLKAFGPMFAVSNKLYLTAYNPVPKSAPLAVCQPQVIGSTEVYQFCLPYGNCNTDDRTYSTHIQRIGYGKGLTPLSWKTEGGGKTRRLFEVETAGIDSEASSTEEAHLLASLNLNDIDTAPKFVNTFTLQPQLVLEQWFDYSNHLSTSD